LMAGAIDDRENALRFLQTIKNHSERLNSLVEDLLTLSRIELGDIRIEKTAVSLDDIVDTVFTTLRNKAEIKGIYLRKEMPENLGEINADRNRLTQILLTSGAGRIWYDITCQQRQPEGETRCNWLLSQSSLAFQTIKESGE
ncbi:MAG: hypothetical protein KKD68_08115, partial [Proteobacteria bacterium]|nr:hypothetical protein [Pseudomonadota bacterium]